MPKRPINECYDVYMNGDPLNDEELKRFHAHMVKTAKMLSELGPSFHLAMHECIRISNSTKGYLDARYEKRGFFRRSIE